LKGVANSKRMAVLCINFRRPSIWRVRPQRLLGLAIFSLLNVNTEVYLMFR
jgi:hypothetical protein